MSFEIVILAAGKGSRMQSDLPKVLHIIAGQSLLAHVIKAAQQLNPAKIHVVVGHQAQRVQDSFKNIPAINWIVQAQQNGTGHALKIALPELTQTRVLVMNGDVPLVEASDLQPLLERIHEVSLLTVDLENPHGFGRIIRNDDGHISEIVEEKDASEEQCHIREINTGIMALPTAYLNSWLNALNSANAQGELYLTDVMQLAYQQGVVISGFKARSADTVLGINSRADQSSVERIAQKQLAHQLMHEGVALSDPDRFDLRGTLKTGRDCSIDINAVFEGDNTFGDGVHIGPNCVIKNARIGSHTRVHANSIIEGAVIHQNCQVGPFARIRPDTVLGDFCKIGNFVEIKKSTLDAGSKASHLSYLGDSQIGSGVNIGAGVITCNYDGVNKHQTIIGNDVFVGSDCQLVAPVTIGEGATIGAGTTLSKDAPAGYLTLSRSKQTTFKAWAKPIKENA